MTNLSIHRKRYGGDDMTWLGSREGVDTAATITLDAAAFTVDDGVVKSGTPVEASGDKYAPYGGTNPLAGFVVHGVSVADGDAVAALLDRGRINADNLPVEGFLNPADGGRFVYVGGTDAGGEV